MNITITFTENDHLGPEMRWTATAQNEPPYRGHGATKADALKGLAAAWARQGGQ